MKRNNTTKTNYEKSYFNPSRQVQLGGSVK